MSRVVVKGTSPIGSAQWFKMVKPDQKFNKYSVDLIVEDSEELQKILNQIEEMTAETISENKKLAKTPQLAAKIKDSGNRPIIEELDSEGKPTGKYIMKFRGASSGKRKDETVYTVAPPALFNAKAQPITGMDREATQVPNGSLIKVSYELSPYYVSASGAGVSLKPRAAMIIKAQSVQSADQFGFSASEMSEQDDSENEDFSSESKSEANDNEDF